MKDATFKKLMAATTQAVKHSEGKVKLKTTRRKPKKAKR